ncbi:MAG: phosphatidylglycerophosphatase A [Mariprofundaceae bacterium]
MTFDSTSNNRFLRERHKHMLIHQACRYIAAGFGSGWLPKAPGTWGSLAALMIAIPLLSICSVLQFWAITIAVTIIGCVVCAVVLRGALELDPGWIVIDEWAGQWLTLAVAVSAGGKIDILLFIGAFFLFRLFDIFKPFPVSKAESWGAKWWSVMADDLVAGFMAGCTLSAILLILDL